MEFVLNEYHRVLSDEELLEDIKQVARQAGKNTLSKSEYIQLGGKFAYSTIEKHFGSWLNALKRCGFILSKEQLNTKGLSNELLIEDLRNASIKLKKKCVTTREYSQYGNHSIDIFFSRFGSWDNALKQAGLNSTGFRSKVTIQELIEEIERIWIQLGRQPTTTDIKNGVSKFSLNSYARKFGSWRKALEYFVEYINSDDQQEKKEVDSEHFEETIPSSQPILTTRKTKRDINLRLRFLVMKRDNFKCCMCGRSPATTPNLILHIDHIVPWSKGGETVIENLQTLCQDCNLGKSNLE